jgi:oligopeptide transport system ATP-binding protein
MTAPLLDVEDLRVEFRTRDGVVRAVDGAGYRVEAGRTLAVLGESGSGKSVTARAVMGILETPPGRITGGRISFRGRDLLAMPERERRALRGARMSMVFQDALSALNPVLTVGHQLAEMFTTHRGTSRRQARARAVELMDRVRIPAAHQRAGDYPHQFSGGMRQRVMIAMAIALDPELVIADEPTTALDVTVQAQVMDLLAQLRREMGMGMVLITHDLGVVAEAADDIAVMYAGRVVEKAPVAGLYAAPAHPYTRALLDSVPRLDRRGGQLYAIGGQPPDPARLPGGCTFHPRCPMARERCRTEEPRLLPAGPGRASACHYWTELAGAGGSAPVKGARP